MTSLGIVLFLGASILHVAEAYAANVQNPKLHAIPSPTTMKPTKPPPQDGCFVNQGASKKSKSFPENPKHGLPSKNCSDYHEVEITKTQISEIERWKTQVVIACTITAAAEIFIVVIIVLYWKQIRWSLRKLQCPCDESSRRQRAQRQERRRRQRALQRRLHHLVVTTTRNAITATSQPAPPAVASHSLAGTSHRREHSDSLLHPDSHFAHVHIKRQSKSNSNRDKLESKPPDQQRMPMLSTEMDKTSIHSTTSDRSLSEEMEPIPSTSYAHNSTRDVRKLSRDKHFILTRVTVSDSESGSDFDCSEITTVQVHR